MLVLVPIQKDVVTERDLQLALPNKRKPFLCPLPYLFFELSREVLDTGQPFPSHFCRTSFFVFWDPHAFPFCAINVGDRNKPDSVLFLWGWIVSVMSCSRFTSNFGIVPLETASPSFKTALRSSLFHPWKTISTRTMSLLYERYFGRFYCLYSPSLPKYSSLVGFWKYPWFVGFWLGWMHGWHAMVM